LLKAGHRLSFRFHFGEIKRKEETMTCKIECTQFELAMELLIENGFDGIADIYY
jgi:hypothetical protein